MDHAVFTTIAITGFTIAFLHATIPTHWLPFVLTARVQKWSRVRTLLITALAGSGHVAFTALLGFLVAWCGIALSDKIGKWFPFIAGGALLAFGLYYILQQLLGKGHGHAHGFSGLSHEHHKEREHHNHEHSHPEHEEEPEGEELRPPPRRSDWAATISLLALLTFSPCEGFLPVYVSGVRFGWSGFFMLTLILSVATVAGMVLFTWLTLAGMEKLSLQALEKYERGFLGGVLCALGILIMIFEH